MSAALVLVAALELFASQGAATWGECGTVGCWREPPLPYTQELRAPTSAVGVRVGDFELSWRNQGTTRVRGVFVEDAQYDSAARALRSADATLYATSATQRATGWALMYAPRFSVGALYVQPSIGAMQSRQDLTIDQHQVADPSATWSYHEVKSNRVTPAAGVAIGYRLTASASVFASFDAAWRPRYANSIAGGGADSPIGFRAVSVGVRWVLR